MKYIAWLYSILFGCAALWSWASYFLYANSTKEHLLPGFILNIVTLPLSLIMEKLVYLFPSLMDSAIFQLSLVTGFGILQVLLLWQLVTRGFIRKRKLHNGKL